MILKTKEFQAICKNILLAVEDNAANLELSVRNDLLYLSVTNREYYVSIKFQLDNPEDFKAVVNAKVFLDLISSITTETFELKIKDNTIVIKSGKSSYKVAMIYENDSLATLQPIILSNITVDMPISFDILKSIVDVNSKELLKVKNIDVNELQRLYYIDQDGCFTFTTGACLNRFKLEKPVKLLLNDRIVKLFKLFKDDVHFSFGHDQLSNGTLQTKIVLQSSDIYLSAIITNDDLLLSKVQGPCNATKEFINTHYSNNLVLSVNELNAAISRMMLFTKNSVDKTNSNLILATLTLSQTELTITDKLENSEVITVEAGSVVDDGYSMIVNLADLKSVLDSCKDEHITLNCGNHRSVVITRGQISNLIPEGQKA